MTQLFGPSSGSATPNERKAPSSPSNNGRSSHFPQRIKNFFKISSNSNDGGPSNGGSSTNGSGSGGGGGLHPFRQSRFLRGRSTSSASQLDHDGVSPTAHANPYFAHQGQPALRHHNDASRPPSPPDTPKLVPTILTPNGDDAAGKEELQRKLRRVASAPNAQGLFSSNSKDRPGTADPLKNLQNSPLAPSPLGGSDSPPMGKSNLLVPTAKDPRTENLKQGFKRTYSSNSIKVRNVEVGPQSFDKIKLLGKGDVGKVYLVREKKSNRLYAMKGKLLNTRNVSYLC